MSHALVSLIWSKRRSNGLRIPRMDDNRCDNIFKATNFGTNLGVSNWDPNKFSDILIGVYRSWFLFCTAKTKWIFVLINCYP